MSQQAMGEFMSSVFQDAALADRFWKAGSMNEGPEAMRAIARVAGEAGYDVDVFDVASFRDRAHKVFEDATVSDERLEEVSGGLFGVDDLLLAGGAAVAVGTLATAAIGTAGSAAVGSAFFPNETGKVVDFLSKW